MWSMLLALKTTLSYTFYVSVKIGQFIVTSLYSLLTIVLYFLNKVLILLSVIIEDFTIFLRDVGHNMNSIVDGIVYTFERISAGINTTWNGIVYVLQLIYTSAMLVYNAGFNGILTVLNAIKNIFVFVKQIIIMFGDGVWFIIIYIPKSVLSLIPLAFNNAKNLCIHVHDGIYASVKNSCDLTLEAMFDCYHFLTDVPVESIVGLIIAVCFLYIFLQFYSILFMYLRNTVSSFLCGLRLMYNRLKTTVIRRLTRNNQEVASRSRPIANKPTSTKMNEEGACIICQDRAKCILVLPCKHLCLCIDCTPRLMRYSGRCPICRKQINSTMKIFT